MSAGRVVGIVIAAILLLFGILWLLAATSSSAENASPGGRFVIGIILLVAGGLLLFAAVKRPAKEEDQKEMTIVQKIELPGDLRLEEMKCSSCGAKLDKDSIAVKAGSVMVSCKYCGSQYKLEEEPKW